MSKTVADEVIVVTGANGELGRATARTILEAGGRVGLIDRSADIPEELLQAFTKEVIALPSTDLVDPAQATQAIAMVESHFGRVDALINIAGAFRWQKIAESSMDMWDLMSAVNLKTAVNCCQAALVCMRRAGRGTIVNVGAYAALRAAAGMGPYTASKSGVHRLTESLAEEVKDEGITVNAVLPSIIDTPANRADMPQADFSRWVTPQALADVILFLASRRSRAITGALLPVTGRV